MTERTALYRIWGDADVLLYIGISKRFGARWKEHARDQPWWDEMRRISADEWHDSREEAKAAETAAIKAEQPRFNIAEADYRERPVQSLPPLWDGDGDVLAQIDRLLASRCENHSLIMLMIATLVEGHREVPAGNELERLAAKIHVSRANAYRLLKMTRIGLVAHDARLLTVRPHNRRPAA